MLQFLQQRLFIRIHNGCRGVVGTTGQFISTQGTTQASIKAIGRRVGWRAIHGDRNRVICRLSFATAVQSVLSGVSIVGRHCDSTLIGHHNAPALLNSIPVSNTDSSPVLTRCITQMLTCPNCIGDAETEQLFINNKTSAKQPRSI